MESNKQPLKNTVHISRCTFHQQKTLITDKNSIIKNLEESFDLVTAFFDAYPDEKFSERKGDAWSAAQHFEHLQLGNRLLIKALKIPRFIFRAKFGKANRPVRDYDKVVSRYKERMSQRKSIATAPQFEPENVSDRGKAMRQWEMQKQQLCKAIGKWSESDLDKHILPHPLMGKLIVREMLYFINHHTLQHLEILNERY